jgi:pimeloyl-ACP methyl ester carboxylesterase
VLEFRKIIGPLTDPVAHGGDAADAFHVVAPSLPGFGFSEKPAQAGWSVERIARAWGVLMTRLRYDRFVAQGGDWGSAVTIAMGVQQPPGLVGIHLNMLSINPPDPPGDQNALDTEEQIAIEARRQFVTIESGYARLQATRPQTIGYSLADSPIGQAAWIYEKFRNWSDCNGDPATIFSQDELLDNITLYWLTNSGASSARLYWESMGAFRPMHVTLPVGFTQFPKEITHPARKWADLIFPDIIHWKKADRGGHFAALEQPEILVEELRTCFRHLR